MKKVLRKLHTLSHYVKSEGVVATTHRVKNRMLRPKHGPRVLQNIMVMAKTEDVIRADFVGHPYKKPVKKKKQGEKLKIGWVLSPISRGSGGQNTITRFIRHLSAQGHENMVYLYEGIHPQRASEAKQILKESFHTDVPVKSIDNYQECDVVLATGWETAYPLFNLKTKAAKFYFVQDYEPYFYATGSKSILAANTYRFGFYGITAGRWLTHRLSTEYGMSCDFFDFGADFDEYRMVNKSSRNIICFYARPVTERRAFELGVIALEEFQRKHPEYEIHFFGWDVSDYNIPFPYVNRGILNHQELAVLYNESAACLVLSLTNVSLLPFELLAAGCIPVMNDGDNNRMVLGENNYIAYAGASPAELVAALHAAVSLSTDEQLKRAEKASKSVANKSWDDAGVKVEAILKRELYAK